MIFGKFFFYLFTKNLLVSLLFYPRINEMPGEEEEEEEEASSLPSEFIIFQPPQSRAGTIVARSRPGGDF